MVKPSIKTNTCFYATKNYIGSYRTKGKRNEIKRIDG